VRIVVTGAGGQLGYDVADACARAGDDVNALDHTQLDVSDRDAVLGAITAFSPHAVVHCAAWTAVDACESDPERAYRDNALAVRWVAEAARRSGAHLVHVSTDYVFDGAKREPYVEWDVPNPTSVYGASKWAGEREAVEGAPGATVIRTSWVCGAHGANMVKTVLRLAAAEQPSLRFVDDQRGNPSFTADLAPMVRRLAIERRPGIHHVTNRGSVSWFEFAQAVVEAAGRDPGIVEPIATADLQPKRPAPRPANSVLDNAVLRASGIPLLADFHEPLVQLVHRLLSG
jgi:dTDP-4-dehydrorhamnose reductase